MAYAERRGKLWRVRWRAPDGTLEAKSGFRTRKAAENYGRDQEAAVRSNTYIDPKTVAAAVTNKETCNQGKQQLRLLLRLASSAAGASGRRSSFANGCRELQLEVHIEIVWRWTSFNPPEDDISGTSDEVH